jgi:surface antigen
MRPAGILMTTILIGAAITLSGCGVARLDSLVVRDDGGGDTTGSIARMTAHKPRPTATDLAFARTAASDVLTRGDKDASLPWENPATGARGSVTPLASAYSSDGRTCRDFLASYVNGASQSWMQGAACRGEGGRWEVESLKPWNEG